MKANPGGVSSVKAVLGREVETERIRKALMTQSVLLVSERRIGKTCVLRKVEANPPDGWAPLLCFIESKTHPIELVEALFEQAKIKHVLSRKLRACSWLKERYDHVAGAEGLGFALPRLKTGWKKLLAKLIEDIIKKSTKPLLIILDEFPKAVSNIQKNHGPSMAMEVLDTFREIRQRHEKGGKFRMLLSGSIGLHLVVEGLKCEHGYRGTPTSDLCHEELHEMSQEDCGLMCQALLLDENIEVIDFPEFTTSLYKQTGGLPLYIQWVCRKFQDEQRRSVEPGDIRQKVDLLFDDWNVEWFDNAVERIDGYYRDKADIAHAILDSLCHHDIYVPEGELINLAKHRVSIDSDRKIKDTLKILRRDQYLTRQAENGRCYRFRYDLTRQWWKINRG